jgi:putative heme-binding domain-containing protein
LDYDSFRQVSQQGVEAGWQAAHTIAMAYALREPGVNLYALGIGLKILKKDLPIELKREAALLMQLALGGVINQVKDFGPVFQGYVSASPLEPVERELDEFRLELHNLFPTNDALLDEELSRLLAMMRPLNPELVSKFLAKITGETHPVADIHYLLCAGRIGVERTQDQREKTAQALIQLDLKIKNLKLAQDSHWDARMRELYSALCKSDVMLPKALINHPEFGRPGHIVYLIDVDEALLPTAIEKFLVEIRKDIENYPWTNDTVFLLSESEDPEVWKLIVKQLTNFAVKPAVLLVLAMQEEEKYRTYLLQGLELSQKDVLENCLKTLEKFSPSRNPMEQVALLFAARRLKENAQEFGFRDRIIKLLERNTQENFGFVHGEAGYNQQTEALGKWTEYIEKRYKNTVSEFRGTEVNIDDFLARLGKVDFKNGNPIIGEKLFAARSCASCHGGKQALGPDLTGATKRFSTRDLFVAIVDPNRDVSNRYQTTMLQMSNGKSFTGLIVYEAVDGLLLRTALNQTFRLETADIDSRKLSNTSLMPAGLLKDFTNQDIADLYAYMSLIGQPNIKAASDPEAESPPAPPLKVKDEVSKSAKLPTEGNFPAN